MSSSTREQILGRIRRSLKRGKVSTEVRTNLESRLAVPPRYVRPGFPETNKQRFEQKLHSAGASLSIIETWHQIPQAAMRYLKAQQLKGPLHVAPGLKGLVWPEDFETSSHYDRDMPMAASLTPAFAGIAETGSIVMLSGAHSPTGLNFLPEHHIVVIEEEQIVAYMEDVWMHLRHLPDNIPRTINVITGPSRTADIEQTIQLGAHGPRSLHVIFLTQPR